jgi:hypothetical protein
VPQRRLPLAGSRPDGEPRVILDARHGEPLLQLTGGGLGDRAASVVHDFPRALAVRAPPGLFEPLDVVTVAECGSRSKMS